MTRSLGVILSVLASIVAGASSGSASPPLPEHLRIPLTVEQAAALTMPRYEHIVEAIVESVQPITVERGQGCQWVTELELRPVRQLRGMVWDETFRALTMSVPDSLPPPRGCSIGHLSDEIALPKPGARGLFLLVSGKSDLSLIDNIPTLPSVSGMFWPITLDGIVNASLMGSSYSWPYEDLAAAFDQQAAKLTVEATSKDATVVLLGRAGEYDQHLRFRFPLAVERVYRGKIAADTVFLNFEMGNEPEGQEGILQRTRNLMRMGEFRQILPARLLVFATEFGAIDITPAGLGFLPLDSQNMVSLPEGKIESGIAKAMTQSLAELEVLLR
jgi:hypothetical protein